MEFKLYFYTFIFLYVFEFKLFYCNITTPLKVYKYRIIENFNHDSNSNNNIKSGSNSFTQGLLFLNSSVLVESSGLYGKSYIKLVSYPSMVELIKYRLPSNYFGEGTTVYNQTLYQLTWESNKILAYNATNLKLIKLYKYKMKGWGLTSSKEKVWATDGNNDLLELEIPPLDSDENEVYVKNRTLITCLNETINGLNELEYIEKTKSIWGNIYGTPYIIEIDPSTGICKSIVDFKYTNDPEFIGESQFVILNDVLNGVAYHEMFDNYTNSENLVLLVTGKRWKKFYLVELEEHIGLVDDRINNINNISDYLRTVNEGDRIFLS